MGANLITIDEYKASENLKSLENDAHLNSLISHVSQLIKTYCANSFVDYFTSDKVEVYSPLRGTAMLQTAESPLVSVTTVELRESDNTWTALTENEDYYINLVVDGVYRYSSGNPACWPEGPNTVRVTYKAGYDIADIPGDLKLVTIDLFRYYDKDEYKIRRTIGGASMANDPTSTQWRNVGFPDHIKRVLDLHKLVTP
jgi:hypothetical protein